MSVEVRLLGRPCAWRDGEQIAIRGHKPWVLLALLVLEGVRVTRDRLARMLFTDATDPAAALRWNLSQLRRCLGLRLTGDPILLIIPEDVAVDLQLLLHGDTDEAAAVSGLNEDLLAGVRVEAASELAMWLDDERRHLRRLGIDVREEAALTRLGRGDTDAALLLARQVAEASPLDENAAALLVRCLRAAGRSAEARTAAERAASRLRDELGVEPTDRLWSAVATPPGGDRRVTGQRAVIAQLDAGASAVAAGATDTGIAALRSVDQEGLTLLHEAVPLTATVDDPALAARTRREIGYVDFLRGRYDRALRWFDQARQAGDGATTEVGWIDVYAGTSRDDTGDRSEAAQLFDRALRTAQSERDPRLEAYTLAVVGRHHLMLDNLDEAQRALDAAVQIVHAIGWTSFHAWPEALLADVIRHRGDLQRARALSEQAYVLAEHVDDPCWLAAALRSLGLVMVDAGDVDHGVALLRDVPILCRRLPDTYRWVELWGYDALVDVARRHQLGEAQVWADHLMTEASALGMRPFAQRARSSEPPATPPAHVSVHSD